MLGYYRSGLGTGDMSYTHDQYGTFFGHVFALRTAAFTNEARLPFRSSLKVAHHAGCLCKMNDGFMLAGESAVSAPGDHRSRGIQCRILILNPTLQVG